MASFGSSLTAVSNSALSALDMDCDAGALNYARMHDGMSTVMGIDPAITSDAATYGYSTYTVNTDGILRVNPENIFKPKPKRFIDELRSELNEWHGSLN
jgi:hypothetical protein